MHLSGLLSALSLVVLVMMTSSVIALPARGRIYRGEKLMKGEDTGQWIKRLWRNHYAEAGAAFDQCVAKRVKKDLEKSIWDRFSTLWKDRSKPEPRPSIEQAEAKLELYKRHKEICKEQIMQSNRVMVSEEWQKGYLVREGLRRNLALSKSANQPRASLEKLRNLIPFLREEKGQDGGAQDPGSTNEMTSLSEPPGTSAKTVFMNGVGRAFITGSKGRDGQIPVNGARLASFPSAPALGP